MNLLQMHLMDKPSIERPDGMCCICGVRLANESHHIVPRSQGGKDGPTIRVCGWGNTCGCHGKLHRHTLHVYHMDGWVYLETDEPMKLEEALAQDGWRPVYRCPDIEAMNENVSEFLGGF